MYADHSVVIFDDLRASRTPFAELLRVLDMYPLTLERKGGHVVIAAEHYIITTDRAPTVFYLPDQLDDGDVRQLLRRITYVGQFFRSYDLEGATTYVEIDATETFQCGKYFV